MSAPEPVGYDPSIIPVWTSPTAESFVAMKLTPWRLRVMPGEVMTQARADLLLTWTRETDHVPRDLEVFAGFDDEDLADRRDRRSPRRAPRAACSPTPPVNTMRVDAAARARGHRADLAPELVDVDVERERGVGVAFARAVGAPRACRRCRRGP